MGRLRNISENNTWDTGAPVSTNADFESVDYTQLDLPRKSDGSLPDITFLHLVSGSDLIDKGVDVGLPFSGNAPDLGPFEFYASGPDNPVCKSAIIENANSSVLEMNYDLTLDSLKIPPLFCF